MEKTKDLNQLHDALKMYNEINVQFIKYENSIFITESSYEDITNCFYHEKDTKLNKELENIINQIYGKMTINEHNINLIKYGTFYKFVGGLRYNKKIYIFDYEKRDNIPALISYSHDIKNLPYFYVDLILGYELFRGLYKLSHSKDVIEEKFIFRSFVCIELSLDNTIFFNGLEYHYCTSYRNYDYVSQSLCSSEQIKKNCNKIFKIQEDKEKINPKAYDQYMSSELESDDLKRNIFKKDYYNDILVLSFYLEEYEKPRPNFFFYNDYLYTQTEHPSNSLNIIKKFDCIKKKCRVFHSNRKQFSLKCDNLKESEVPKKLYFRNILYIRNTVKCIVIH